MMKSFNLCACVFALFATLSSCNSVEEKSAEDVKYGELEKAAWIIGTWQNSVSGGTVSEIWKKENDSLFTATSFFIRRKDTILSEGIRLEQLGDKLIYTAAVTNQNGGKPVKFFLTSAPGKLMIFENPGHDFPQKIIYRQITADSLVAEISGFSDGEPQSEQFEMKRTN